MPNLSISEMGTTRDRTQFRAQRELQEGGTIPDKAAIFFPPAIDFQSTDQGTVVETSFEYVLSTPSEPSEVTT
jgi:hypothetical protein